MDNIIHSIDQLNAIRDAYRDNVLVRMEDSHPVFEADNVHMNILCCAGTGCTAGESEENIRRFEQLIDENHLQDNVEVIRTGCFGLCQKGPIVAIYPDQVFYTHVHPEDVDRIFFEHVVGRRPLRKKQLCDVDPSTGQTVYDLDRIRFYQKQMRIALRHCGRINPEDINEYIAVDGYQALAMCLREKSPQDVIDIIKASGLRGRGGAGFPTGKKWQFEKDQPGNEKYIICNADEGDPGAFMDRSILEGDPHSVIEGLACMAYAVGAHHGYIYIRAEYPIAVHRLEIALREAREYGLLGRNILSSGFDFDLEIRLGAGAFVCGEETALIASIEGRRGMPSPKPPFPAVSGVWGKPTSINNVETLANVPAILTKGADWYSSIGTAGSKGTKVFALGGKIVNTGLVEVPMGTTLREIIYDIGGGCPDGKRFKAVQTGGPSGGCLTEKELDTPIDYETLTAAGSMMGSGGMIVLDEDSCMVDVARFYMSFICDESCGKCTPCRVGTKRLLEMLDAIAEGRGTLAMLDEMEDLCHEIKDTALCGLGQTAPNPILSSLHKFHDEYVEHVVDHKCRAHVCKRLLRYEIDESACRACSLCARNCPVQAISGEPGRKPYHIDQDKCIKCGSCLNNCRFHAVERL